MIIVKLNCYNGVCGLLNQLYLYYSVLVVNVIFEGYQFIVYYLVLIFYVYCDIEEQLVISQVLLLLVYLLL